MAKLDAAGGPARIVVPRPERKASRPSAWRVLRVGDHVELAGRVLEHLAFLDSAHGFRVDAGELVPLLEGDGGATVDGEKILRAELLTVAATFSGAIINDCNGRASGIVRLTFADLCGIADTALAICGEWFRAPEETG